jgi:CIC family chloride channel protein
MIFEITRDYTIIVPLMISNMIAYFISQKLQPEPIYEALSHQEGIHLPTAETRTLGERMQVQDAMCPVTESDAPASDLPHLHPDHSLSLALQRMGANGLTVLPVVSRANSHHVVGTLSLENILHAYGVEK